MLNKQDKYKAIWLSHSSLTDFENCQRLYYFKNIYKNKNNRKINLVSPYLTLGTKIHNLIESLNNYKVLDRLERIKILDKEYLKSWEEYLGIRGGFSNREEEDGFKERGLIMIKKIQEDPKIFKNKTISQSSYYKGDMLPNYFISEEENIILCGNIDWIEYLEDKNSLRVIDFKTGLNEEKENSPQLLIYKLLLENLNVKWLVTDYAYWYLETGEIKDKFFTQEDVNNLIQKIINIGKIIRDKKLDWDENYGWIQKENLENNFICTSLNKYCDCKKYALIVSEDDRVEYVGVDDWGKDNYYLH